MVRPPAPRPALPVWSVLDRPRLVECLRARWDVPLVAVVGGPGFGKTTLLALTLEENARAPRGLDVFVPCRSTSASAAVLLGDLATALDAAPDALHDALWRLAPSQVCLVLDDVHEVPDGSTAAAAMQALLDDLPANAHLLLAGRGPPPVRTARLASRGELLVLGEDELRFDPEEVTAFAALRGTDPAALAGASGWPALAELAARTGGTVVARYLWEEVLDRLEPDRRRHLALLADIGAADEALAGAVLGDPALLAATLRDVPLVAERAGGWCHVHPLWREALAGTLDDEERRTARVAAAAVESARGRVAEAFSLLASVAAWEEAARLATACTGVAHPPVPADVLVGWARALPVELRDAPVGLLLRGVAAKADDPNRADELLRAAVDGFRAAGDGAGEMAASAHLGHVARWREDSATLLTLVTRAFELDAAGLPDAAVLADLGRIAIADASGDHQAALRTVRAARDTDLNAEWRAIFDWFEAVELVQVGDGDAAVVAAERCAADAGPLFAPFASEALAAALWTAGRLEEAREAAAVMLRGYADAGLTGNVGLAHIHVAVMEAFAGDVDEARRHVRLAWEVVERTGAARGRPMLAAIEVLLAVADGDDAAATERLRTVLADPATVPIRHHVEVLVQVLDPAERTTGPAPLSGRPAVAREVALALVAVRERDDVAAVRALRWPSVGLLQTMLPVPWAALFAAAGEAAGVPDGRELFTALGPPGRDAMHALAEQDGEVGTAARRLLRQLPPAPAQALDLHVLGRLELRRGGAVVDDTAWRRGRVRSMLAFLVAHPRTTRAAVAVALWPDAAPAAAANNVRVTLSRLLAVLQPERREGEPSSVLVADGADLHLVAGPHLVVDAWDVERLLDEAADAERQGRPAVSLERSLAAIERYGGDVDVPDEWAVRWADQLRSRFVAAAVRAGELLLARGEAPAAVSLAARAVAAEPWSEAAYRLRAAAELASGARGEARRTLQRCWAMLAELGVEPEEESRELERLLGARTG